MSHSRVLLVTGGSRGIGAATCRLAARAGYAVAINYLDNRDAAESLVSEIEDAGGAAMAVQADVAKLDHIQRMFAEVDQFGRLVGLVNNAGITGRGSRLDRSSSPHSEHRSAGFG